jgi:acetyltransferase
MVRFSQLVVEQPWIKEIDINPLLASPDRLIALDARVLLHGTDMTEDKLPQPAIRPYPIQYVQEWSSKDSTPVLFRPIRPEDEPLIAKFHEGLSERTVFLRYLQAMNYNQRIAHERLSRLSFIDYDREMALVAVRGSETSDSGEIMGIGRLRKDPGTPRAEFNILVSDSFQHQGLGTELLRRLIEIGKDEKVGLIVGNVLAENTEMIRVVEKFGFETRPTERESILRAELKL